MVFGAKVFIGVDDLDALHQELTDRKDTHMRPGVELTDWGRILNVMEPFGNNLVFAQEATSK